jgi:hypothetical protein
MKENSRIRFNPVKKEVEVEGSEEFVKTYFSKIQAMISGVPEAIAEEPKAVKVRSTKKAKKEPKAAKPRPKKKAKKATKKEPGEKRVTNIGMIVGLIQGSTEGISTSELKEKTGLSGRQIWGVVTHAAKEGKIKKGKRGLYGAV